MWAEFSRWVGEYPVERTILCIETVVVVFGGFFAWYRNRSLMGQNRSLMDKIDKLTVLVQSMHRDSDPEQKQKIEELAKKIEVQVAFEAVLTKENGTVEVRKING